MKIITTFYSNDDVRKTILVKTNDVCNPYGLLFFAGEEVVEHTKHFKHIDDAQSYAEEWVQK